MLVLVDNFEQVAEAGTRARTASLEELPKPGAFLVTSRELLRVQRRSRVRGATR